MQSRATFDLDESNYPVVKLEITSSSDVRDKLAKRFIELLGHASQWCQIIQNNDGQYTIFPIKPEELGHHAEIMKAWADEIDKHKDATAIQ